MKKRIWAVLLCVIMVMALLPATAFAAAGDSIIYTTTDTDPVDVALTVLTEPVGDAPGTVQVGDGVGRACGVDTTSVTLPEVITNSGKSYRVTTVGAYAFSGLSDLQSVSLAGVTNIGQYAFEDCSSLQNVTIWQTSAPVLADDTVFSGVQLTCMLCVPDGASGNYSLVYGWFFENRCELWPVTGTVYDEGGDPAVNATVSVYGISAMTDSSGTYTVYVNPNDNTDITASIADAGEKSISVRNVTGALSDQHIYFGKAAVPTFTPATGTYKGTASVSISAAPGATIRYTTNGNEPTASSNEYTAPISISSTTTLIAKAFQTGLEASDTVGATYTITNKATSVLIAGVELTSEMPCYHNGEAGAAGEANADAANAHAIFDPAAGTLTLKGLSVVDSTVTPELNLSTGTIPCANAIFADGDLTICVDGDNSVSVDRITQASDDAYSFALYVAGELTVQPGVTGSGSLTVESKGATGGRTRGYAVCAAVTSKTLEVKYGATLTGKVIGNSTADNVQNIGVNIDAVTVSGGTLKGIVSGETISEISSSDFAISCGINVNKGHLSLSAGSVEATSGQVTGDTGTSYAVSMSRPTDRINITGGSFTAKSGTAATSFALNSVLSLESGITTTGSTSSNGSNPVPYVAADNATYKWVQAQKLLPALTVTSSVSGSVALNTAVTLTANVTNVEEPTFQWYSNASPSTEGAVPITGANANTYAPPTNVAGTVYYYCAVPEVAHSNIVGVTVNQPASYDDDDDDDDPPVTVYNDPSVPDATVWLTGKGLDSSDLLVTDRYPEGSEYSKMMKLAYDSDIMSTYNIYLRSGRKSTGNAMNLTFDLNATYAGDAFTLVHQKADSTYEYFYNTADASGDLSFGPLYELSPFMLVKGTLAPAPIANNPETGVQTQPGLWGGIALLVCAGVAAVSLVLIRKKRQNA